MHNLNFFKALLFTEMRYSDSKRIRSMGKVYNRLKSYSAKTAHKVVAILVYSFL